MKFKLKVYNIWEPGKRVDVSGKPHQEDSIFPEFEKATDSDRLFILCDGMGGHDAGEVASLAVCEGVSKYILDSESIRNGNFTQFDLEQAIGAGYDYLDKMDTGASKKMGTTMTLLKFYDGGACVAHIGDSRVYQIRPGKNAESTRILFMTRDHSLVNELVMAGEISEEEARHSPKKNVITRAMQPNMERRCKPDVNWIKDIRPGDYFYMCSDGMLEEMTDRQLCFHFSDSGGDPKTKVKNLIRATRENRDNHTAFIIHITDVERKSETPESSDAMPLASHTISSDLAGCGNTDTPLTSSVRGAGIGKYNIIKIIGITVMAVAAIIAMFLLFFK